MPCRYWIQTMVLDKLRKRDFWSCSKKILSKAIAYALPDSFKYNRTPQKITLKDLPSEILLMLAEYDLNISTLLLVCQHFLYIYSPLLYRNMHGFISVMTTKDILINDKRILSGEFWAEEWTKDHPIQSILMNRYKIYERYKRASSSDYRFIEVVQNEDYLELSERQPKKIGDVTLLQDPRKLAKLFTNVVNNEKSIMKKFIRRLSVDLNFLDELQSQKHGFLSTILKKHSYRQYITAHSKTFQVFNCDPSEQVNYPIPREMTPEEKWTRYENMYYGVPTKKLPMVSKILDLFLTRDREDSIRFNTKNKLKALVDKAFVNLQSINKRFICHTMNQFFLMGFNNILNYQECKERAMVEASKQKLLKDQFASRNEVEEMVESIVQGICHSSVKEKSLLITSMKKDNVSKTSQRDEREAFVVQKANVILLNRKV